MTRHPLPPRPGDVETVRRLAQIATAPRDPADNDTQGLAWALVLICIAMPIAGCVIALVGSEIARHWVGLLQLGAAWVVLSLVVLGIDRAVCALIRFTRRCVCQLRRLP